MQNQPTNRVYYRSKEVTQTRQQNSESLSVINTWHAMVHICSQGHHTIDLLEERGVERGSARRPSFKGRERAIVNQMNIGTVSKATLGKLLIDGVERIWAFPSAEMPSWTELNMYNHTQLKISKMLLNSDFGWESDIERPSKAVRSKACENVTFYVKHGFGAQRRIPHRVRDTLQKACNQFNNTLIWCPTRNHWVKSITFLSTQSWYKKKELWMSWTFDFSPVFVFLFCFFFLLFVG